MPVKGNSDNDNKLWHFGDDRKTRRDKGLARLADLCSGSRPIVADVKSAFDPTLAEDKGITYWRL